MYFHLGVAMFPLFVARDLLADYMVICHPGEVELDPLDSSLQQSLFRTIPIPIYAIPSDSGQLLYRPLPYRFIFCPSG